MAWFGCNEGRNPSAPHLPRSIQALPAYTRLDRHGAMEMQLSKLVLDAFGEEGCTKDSSKAKYAPRGGCGSQDLGLTVVMPCVQTDGALLGYYECGSRPPDFERGVRRAGSPSDPDPGRGVIWRRDRNTLNRSSVRRKAGQGPCQNGGSCIELRISFGAVCIFLYIGSTSPPKTVLNPSREVSIAIALHLHCRPLFYSRRKPIRLASALSVGIQVPATNPFPSDHPSVGARLDHKTQLARNPYRESRHFTSIYLTQAAHRPLTPPWLVVSLELCPRLRCDEV